MLNCRLLGRGLGAAALLMLALSPGAFAKNKDQGSFSVGCLASDSTLLNSETNVSQTTPAIVTVSPSSLWPPHHKMADLAVTMTLAADASSPVNVSLTVNDITDDQVTDDNDESGGHGCGKKTSKQGADWSPTTFPTSPQAGSLQFATDSVILTGTQVRRERCAKDGTRTYEISVTCCDTTNKVCDSSPEVLDVTVAKSKKDR